MDRDVSLADLKGTLEYLLQSIFGTNTPIRFRPHFFPFTEPSFEIDILLEAEGQSLIVGSGINNYQKSKSFNVQILDKP